MILKQFTFVLLTTLFSLPLMGQCSLTNISIIQNDCNDNMTADLVMDFDAENGGDLGFQVLANGTNFGIFQYDQLPITIPNVPGDCTTEYDFIIRDIMDPTCGAFLDFGSVCCTECMVSITDFSVSDCQADATFNVDIVVDTNMGAGSIFTIVQDGMVIDSVNAINDTIRLDGYSASEPGLIRYDICLPDCCTRLEFLNPCECSISSIITQIVDCDAEDSLYFATIDFEHILTTDSFQLGFSANGQNNFLGIHAYDDLPVTVGPIDFGDDNRELFIVDLDDFFCFSPAHLGVVNDCNINCQISNVFAESFDCADGTYFMDVEFDIEDISGFAFDVIVDGQLINTFNYGEQSYTVGPIPQNCNDAPVVVIQDALDSLCNDFFIFNDPICCGGEPCLLNFFSITAGCLDSNLTEINIDLVGSVIPPGADISVELLGESFGPFMADAGDIEFSFPSPINGEYPIRIFVVDEPNCAIETTVELLCADNSCDFEIAEINLLDCANEEYLLEIFIGAPYDMATAYNFMVNGTTFGTFPYDSTIVVGPFPADCVSSNSFEYVDSQLENCGENFSFTPPICCDCEINAITLSDVMCTDEGAISSFIFDLETQSSSDSFEIIIDSIFVGTFEYVDLPILLEGNFNSSFFIEIYDLGSAMCTFSDFIDTECENVPPEVCMISDVTVEVLRCDTSSFDISLDFQFDNVTDEFIVSFGADSLLFSYNDLPVTITGLDVGNEIIISIQDAINDCIISTTALLEQCETSTNEHFDSDLVVVQNQKILFITSAYIEVMPARLFDINGNLIKNLEIVNGETVENLSNAPSGIYLLSYIVEGTIRTKKVAIF